jgi:hypothetical protein
MFEGQPIIKVVIAKLLGEFGDPPQKLITEAKEQVRNPIKKF